MTGLFANKVKTITGKPWLLVDESIVSLRRTEGGPALSLQSTIDFRHMTSRSQISVDGTAHGDLEGSRLVSRSNDATERSPRPPPYTPQEAGSLHHMVSCGMLYQLLLPYETDGVATDPCRPAELGPVCSRYPLTQAVAGLEGRYGVSFPKDLLKRKAARSVSRCG